MEKDAVMRRISRDLYANKTAGIRELVANEITAARAAKRLGADPRIEVTILPDRICVWGVNSLGMERRIFDEVYTVLGRSGNFDGTTPGQFGFGRAAYVTISDHMLLETRHRNGDCYTVLGVEGRGFQVDMGTPDIPYGTRITMAPRDGCRLNALEHMVRLMVGRCEIPITLTTESCTEPPGAVPLVAYGLLLRADLPDVEFAVGSVLDNAAHQSFLCGIPVRFRYRGKHVVAGISPIPVSVDIRDERKYPPTPDRERMSEEAERAISHIIDGEIDSRLAGFPEDVGGAMAHPDRRLAYWLGAAPLELNRFVHVYDTSPFSADRINIQVLGDVVGSPVLACRAFYRHNVEAVRARFPSAAFVRRAPEGVTTISEFMKQHGIEPLPRTFGGRAGA